jgi:transcriptional regulator with XRE-family HTH domain
MSAVAGRGGRPECARLAEELRELRARTGLSLNSLAERTAYSRSSWDRYLNGRALPPRGAVESLCRLAGERGGRPLALWELAEVAWSGRSAVVARPSAHGTVPACPPALADAPGGVAIRRRRWPLLAAVALLASGAVGWALVRTAAQPPGPEPTSPLTTAPAALSAKCQGASCTGKNPLAAMCATAPAPDTLADDRTTTGAELEIRYSEKCAASWIRLSRSRIGDKAVITAPGADAGQAQEVRTADTFDATGYNSTPMLYAPRGALLRACLLPPGAPAQCVTSRIPG